MAPLRQYHLAYVSGHVYVWNVMLGRTVDCGGRGLGVDRDEQPSAIRRSAAASTMNRSQPGGQVASLRESTCSRPLGHQGPPAPQLDAGEGDEEEEEEEEPARRPRRHVRRRMDGTRGTPPRRTQSVPLVGVHAVRMGRDHPDWGAL